MKAHYKSQSGRLMVECEGANVKQLFRELANVQEILDADQTCGCCGSPQIKFRVRTKAGNDFYELACEQCHAVLEFGQKKDQVSLFPKRKSDSGGWLPNRGWRVWQGTGQQQAAPARQQAPPARTATPAAPGRRPS